MAKFAVILAAAGHSSRFGAESTRDKKTFRELGGRAVWLRAAELFHARSDVKQLLIVLAPEDIEWFREKFRPNISFMDLEIVEGGEERADSVENALSRVRSEIDFVAVHDAARPLMTADWIEEIFAAALESGAAIPASPISSTVKRVDSGMIEETVPRAGLFAAQTPQVFSRELLVEAFSKRGDFQPTDEAQLVERLGHRVSVVPGSPLNIKITTQDDLKMAEALLSVLPRNKSLDSLAPGADEKPKWLFD
jgi:2-C-methyl-D-erythritol 4-phosphate cytidylyltransferase